MDVGWITAFVDRGRDDFAVAREFWRTVSGSTVSAWRGANGEFATFLPTDGSDAHLRVQCTASATPGSHIDLHVVDVRAGAHECVGLGAAIVADRGSYITLVSPSGMVFCVVPHQGERLRQRPVVLGPGGSTTLVDQVTIDCDPDHFAAEVRFWSSITGWASHPARVPEFAPLDRLPEMPLRVMLQRRSHGSGRSACHLDLACDDVPATVRAHVERGASLVDEYPLWSVMADPVGVHYCLTSRQPATGLLAPAD